MTGHFDKIHLEYVYILFKNLLQPDYFGKMC